MDTQMIDENYKDMNSIMVVDDDILFLDMCTELFSDLGYKIKTATNGQLAWELFKKSPDKYLFITTDHDMPIMTGDDLILKLREHEFHIPVVLISGNLNTIDKSIADLKDVHFLAKPFNITEVETVFNKCRHYSEV